MGMLKTILEDALHITNGAREESYGSAEDSFGLIARYWSVYLGIELKAHDIAVMMILLKVARQQYRHKKDNLIDIAGYARLLSKMQGDEDNGINSKESQT